MFDDRTLLSFDRSLTIHFLKNYDFLVINLAHNDGTGAYQFAAKGFNAKSLGVTFAAIS